MRAVYCTADKNNFPAKNSSGMFFTAESFTAGNFPVDAQQDKGAMQSSVPVMPVSADRQKKEQIFRFALFS